MGLQDKIARANSGARVKLHDLMITQVGTETKVVRLKIEESLEGDPEDVVVTKSDTVILYLDLPDEIPISRFRSNLTSQSAVTSNVFFYDILPIEVYSRYSDGIEKDDIIIRKLRWKNNQIFYHVLQITETLGNFSANELSFQKFYSAPYTMPLTDEIQNIVDGYLE